MHRAAGLLLAALLPLAAGAALACGWREVTAIPVSPPAFVQGLALHRGSLYLSSGLYGASHLRRLDPATGRELARRELPADVFAEGLAVHSGMVFVLTWREGRVLRFAADTLEPLGDLPLDGQGWGLAGDGLRLAQSDGSARLAFRDPTTFRAVSTVEVRDGGRPVERLNELEFVRGRLLANVWGLARAAIIDPADGRVLDWLDLSALAARHPSDDPDAVLNGLAYDPATGRLYASGKRWPAIHVLELRGCPALGLPAGVDGRRPVP